MSTKTNSICNRLSVLALLIANLIKIWDHFWLIYKFVKIGWLTIRLALGASPAQTLGQSLQREPSYDTSNKTEWNGRKEESYTVNFALLFLFLQPPCRALLSAIRKITFRFCNNVLTAYVRNLYRTVDDDKAMEELPDKH